MKKFIQEEIDEVLSDFNRFSERDIDKLMRKFQRKQKAILVYVAAVAQREELNDEEYDLLITMTLLSWRLFDTKCPKLSKVTVEELDRVDDLLYETVEKQPESLAQIANHPQAELLSNIHNAILGSDPQVREENKPIIYFTLRNVLDVLIVACS
jgi:hypothetical protein